MRNDFDKRESLSVQEVFRFNPPLIEAAPRCPSCGVAPPCKRKSTTNSLPVKKGILQTHLE